MRPAARLSTTAILCAALFAALASHRAAADDRAALHLQIQGDDDHALSLTLGGWAADIVRSALPSVVHCGGDSDERVTTVLRFLDRHGEGTRYTLWDEGREFTGWRRHGRFELRIGARPGWHHGAAHIEAPWGLAECMLGGTVAIGELIDGGSHGTGLDLLVAGDDGQLHLSLH